MNRVKFYMKNFRWCAELDGVLVVSGADTEEEAKDSLITYLLELVPVNPD
jgi:hypothetical protein